MNAVSASLTDDERREIARRGFANPYWFCKFFLYEWFSSPMPWVHRGLLAVLTRRCEFLLEFDEHYGMKELKKIITHFSWREDPANEASPEHSIFVLSEVDGALSISMVLGRHTLVMMPRGSSKTTIANAVKIWKVVYLVSRFIVYVSESSPHAVQQLTNVAHQLSTNVRLLEVFGDLRPDQREGRWSESLGYIQTRTGVTIMAKGRGQQVRGLNVDALRPDDIQPDDVEDKESVSTAEQRKKTKEWFVGDVLPALAELNPNSGVVALGTMLHAESLLCMLMADPDWTVINIQVVDKDGEAIWPHWLNLSAIERKRQSYAIKGMLHIFYMEYFNVIRAPEDAKFKSEYIHIDPVRLDRVPRRVIMCDPAISPSRKADYAYIIVAGMRENGVIQVLDDWYKQGASPRDIIDNYFRLKVLWDTHTQGLETISYQAALQHLMQEEMFRKGKELGPKAYFEITAVPSHAEKKDDRIIGILQPRFASGYIKFQRIFPLLTTMLLDWPNGKKDGPDCLAMGISLLDPVAAMAATEDLSKDQYPPLEEVLDGEWRAH